MQPHIAIIVDHPLRDLSGCALVAAALAKKGARVSLVPMNVMNAEIFALRPDFVLLNYVRSNNASFVRHMIAAGIAYGIMDTEGGLYTHLENYKKVFPKERDVLDHVKIYCSWGKKVADYLVAEHIFTPEQITITGLPRFDFYTSSYRKTQTSKRSMVMINTKVAVANPGVHSTETEIDLYINKLHFPPEKVYWMRDTGLANIRETLRMANQLAWDFPEIDFILRPHPHERLSTYENGILPENKNLVVNQSGGIDEWIIKTSAVIHRSCTTAIEASLAGIPALSASWIPSAAEAADCDAVSVDCKNYDALKIMLRDILSGASIPALPETLIQRMIDDWFHKIDGLSHQRVADAVWDKLPKTMRKNESLCQYFMRRLDKKLLSTHGIAIRLFRFARILLPAKIYWDLLYPARRRWHGSLKSFNLQNVADRLKNQELNIQPANYAEPSYQGFSIDLVKSA